MAYYDVIVIGSGPTAMATAFPCAEARNSVAVIESHKLGGTCPNSGCDPKKILVQTSEVVEATRRLTGDGIAQRVELEWNRLMQAKRRYTENVPSGVKKSFAEAGIDVYNEEARFLGEKELQVGEYRLEASAIVIATGATPSAIEFSGAEYVTTSEDFLELEELPSSIVFLGGGYVSMGLAHLSARTGADVHVIEHNETVLKAFDQSQVETLIKLSEEEGITFHWNTEVKEVRKGDDHRFDIRTNGTTLHVNMIVHGAGRVPNIEGMELAAGNIETKEAGIAVNDYMQSISNAHVYAAGDVAATAGRPLTPISGEEGSVVADNLVKGNHKHMDYTAMPSVVFTLPKVAKVGMTEDEAYQKGVNVAVHDHDTTSWLTYRIGQERKALAKVLVDNENDKIVGAHLLSHEADEIINLFSLALQWGLTAEQLKAGRFAYPTALGDVGSMLG
ncbi:dihydrolipoyl dehydrogenase family protein [Natribacillus halophilus]|uniref:Glutathione reductase (NADPH) n=1 Tax=Natribacillus halophilus TaxID=549003 RepID=A0A1G8Q493_9BACI|nr:NAD(P)/FAD-dependent oxidoreductase [Natribacillus halophilus]SDI99584.1 glutathione reductase (NADPH) [Natribacillus halophilus]